MLEGMAMAKPCNHDSATGCLHIDPESQAFGFTIEPQEYIQGAGRSSMNEIKNDPSDNANKFGEMKKIRGKCEK